MSAVMESVSEGVAPEALEALTAELVKALKTVFDPDSRLRRSSKPSAA